MSEIINLIKGNPDDHVYSDAVEILCEELEEDYSFILQVWKHEMPTKTKYPKVLISTSDESHRLPDQIFDPSFVHIFKQYAPLDNRRIVKKVRGVSALPLCHLKGFENYDIPISERTYDWAWMGQYDPYTRGHFKAAVDLLERERPHYNKHVLWYQGWNNGSGMEEYTNVMNNAKIALVPIGSGSVESFRFFEAMMCGCVVLNTSLPDVPFYNAAPHVNIDKGWRTLNETVDRLLGAKGEMEDYSQKAKKWYEEFCSPRSLANYMAARLQSNGEEGEVVYPKTGGPYNEK